MSTSNKGLISKTLASKMIACIEEYEAIKKKESKTFRTVGEFCEHYKFSHQNFMKIYHRYKANPCEESVLPQKRGPKYKTRRTDLNIEKRILELREKGNNRYEIVRILAEQEKVKISPSTVYNICRRHGLNVLNEEQRKEKRLIISGKAGELGHSDLHCLSKGILEENQNENIYILGIIDDCTRAVWLVPLKDKKALTVTFATLKALGNLKSQYGIEYKAMMTDNGSEFGAGKYAKNKNNNPYEVMLQELGIEHRYIRPYRPQTNGKIERFWRTLEDELLDGVTFKNFQELQDELIGYSLYFNEYRPHSSLSGSTPKEQLEKYT